ncbi:hypothetical protein MPTK1_8g08960 [Marchantia polymorpha subsp. ruderalis]|uniref:Uncharacterized protein n=1 Tax=Marchantia polymorpha TaxID=3197 RepID=A0A2R6WRJ1_MARPO|nr:hypothetical protein MARPO_0063s0023 [Marchantia polymorpha]BBN19237.1 hypothetical protein Mp_8g08960 [Marchantia polymorpha subsp. ruderalis]|eukprot:PTQ36475.1 hypothetical protein MARPO_0063s0023 [Marchantia polymorpha]
MPSFELELDLSVEVGPMWAVMETQNNLLPKLLPEIYQSIDIVEGEGAPGSVRLVMFGSMVPNGGYVQ